MFWKFCYGNNPHEDATAEELFDIKVLVGKPPSLNAYLDIRVGSALAAYKEGRLVYVKHALPGFYLDISSGNDWQQRLKFCTKVNEGRDYGCFVFNGNLSLEIAKEIVRFPHHTLLCREVSSDALEYLRCDNVQSANRGLLVGAGPIHGVELLQLVTKTAHSNISMSAKFPSGDSFADDVERVVRMSRTLSACVFINGELTYNCCGFLDPLQAVKVVLEPFLNFTEANLVLATDACFGVKDPKSVLTNTPISTLYLFGMKPEYPHLVASLESAGLDVHVSERRAFSYPA